jgi:hypothetical protein
MSEGTRAASMAPRSDADSGLKREASSDGPPGAMSTPARTLGSAERKTAPTLPPNEWPK